MTALFGWVGLSSPPNAALSLVKARGGVVNDGESIGGHRIHGPSCGVAAAGTAIQSFHAGGASVIVAGRPRWRDSSDRHPSNRTAECFLEAYRRSGVEALRSLGGTFALVLTVDGGREALVAIDRMGVGAINYQPTDEGVVFGSSSDLVNACLDSPQEIDSQSLYNYVFLHIVPGPATIFRGQFRIPPGGYIQIRDGKLTSGKYWRMSYGERPVADMGELKNEFRAILERGVSDLLDGRAVGAFLSGGTDSSTISGLIAKVSGQPVRTYSIGFKATGYDEIEYARIAARHFDTVHHEHYVTPDEVLALASDMAAFCDQPFGNASAVPTYYCAKLAKSDGVDLILGGDGGDELFGGNERYAMQTIYSWYGRVPGILRKGLIEPLLFGLPATGRLPVFRQGRGYVKQASIPMPDRLHSYNMLVRDPLQSVFTDEFLDRIDPAVPLKLQQAVYQEADARGLLNRMLALDLQLTLADNDLYKVNKMCEMVDIDVGYPMLSDELVAFSARLPSRLKLRGTTLRYFFKEALKDFLPEQIITKRKHGFGLPIGIWMRSHAPLKAMINDAVSALGTRGVLRPEFLHRIRTEHEADDASYWGGELWTLSQLELWLQSHGHPTGQPLI